MKYTPRLGLPLWEPEDRILRTDCNLAGAAEEKLLSAATAAAYGLGASATPDAALDKLKEGVLYRSGALKTVLGANITIPATQLSERVRIESGSYIGTGTFGYQGECSIRGANRIAFAAIRPVNTVNDNIALFLANPMPEVSQNVQNNSFSMYSGNTIFYRSSSDLKTLIWKVQGSGTSAGDQCNYSGQRYEYMLLTY